MYKLQEGSTANNYTALGKNCQVSLGTISRSMFRAFNSFHRRLTVQTSQRVPVHAVAAQPRGGQFLEES